MLKPSGIMVTVKLGKPCPCKFELSLDVESCKFESPKLKFQFPKGNSVRFLKFQSDQSFRIRP